MMRAYFQSNKSPIASVSVAKPVGRSSQGASVMKLSALGQIGQINIQNACGTPAPAHASLIASILAKSVGAPSRGFGRFRQSTCSNGKPITHAIIAMESAGSGNAIVQDCFGFARLPLPDWSKASSPKVRTRPANAPKIGMLKGKLVAPASEARAVATAEPPVRLAPAKETF